MKHKIQFFVAFLLLLTKGFAWYPSYSVMATDFVLPYDFIKPLTIHPVGLQALGPHFYSIYNHPVSNVFQNPAYLSLESQNYIYFDIAGSDNDKDRSNSNSTPGISYGYDDFYYMPYYWSPYRYVHEPENSEPIARFIYLGKPYGENSPIGIGGTIEYYYEQEQFYQPQWYHNGWWEMDALGNYFDSESSDPYGDYRIAEFGNNKLMSSGIQASAMISFDIHSKLSLGLRFTILDKKTDGDYVNLNFTDENDYYDNYLNYSDTKANQNQDYKMNDYSFGVIWNEPDKMVLGGSLGYVTGEIERDFVETDSTFYHSYHFEGPDTNNYSLYDRFGGSRSDKQWKYAGSTSYGNLNGDFFLNSDITLRLAIYGEKRKSDLTESEIMRRDNYYGSRYWNTYTDTVHRFLNISNVNFSRYGTGDNIHKRFKLSIGADVIVSTKIRFIGGVVVDNIDVDMDAHEPFIGSKYSYSERENYSYINWQLQESTQDEEKEFHWYRNEDFFTVAIPTGIIVKAGSNLEFQLGLTKVIKKIDIKEGYDLIVYDESTVTIQDGVTTVSSDSSYVEGHLFPATNEFMNEYEMNAGISFKYKEYFKLTCALKESILEPSYYKIGVEFIF
ncbi:MAG: hypothetical protein HN729_09185 [Candidatus Marinimicrobia bacterium]|jgi:hypothetical protein|nr:hypothetical protein [Candidatus Neomarinimicrobiota bacterium]MBT3633243.1 hypothetical protein [Candidatus Neomarinimicrobiota bacterium]MBT3682156.1 hypothetical protein [Candidatus Neomarinimicrobiota bacterium]MBT3758843.1 hypothetical protein [Candidatus Neomarinimicrobiota bacterium]MBT3895282.1 hypothetical protein [Candidatus Neomarinimicrobiota bacterium]